MTTAQVVKTSVTVNKNGPIQDYVHPDDQTQPTFDYYLLSSSSMYLVQKYLRTSYFLHHSKIALQSTKFKLKNMLFHLSADHYHVPSNS